MKAGIVYFTINGEQTGGKIKNILEKNNYKVDIRNPEVKLKTWVENAFINYDVIIFVAATGIAVRSIAPFLKSKKTDPGVICIDEKGKFIISLLSGHIGGANKLTKLIGDELESIPVITTATDINNKIAIDSFAVENNLEIDDFIMAKEVAMALISNIELGFNSQIKIANDLPDGFILDKDGKHHMGVNISYTLDSVFKNELKLVPKRIILGIGCRRDKEFNKIKEFVIQSLKKLNIDQRAVSKIVSVDIKKNEDGIIKTAEFLKVPFETYTVAQLNNVQGDFTSSEFVRKTIGTDNVCERAAILGSNQGDLLLNKTSNDGITLAIAIDKEEIYVK